MSPSTARFSLSKAVLPIIGGMCTIVAALAAFRSNSPGVTALSVVSGFVSIWAVISSFVKRLSIYRVARKGVRYAVSRIVTVTSPANDIELGVIHGHQPIYRPFRMKPRPKAEIVLPKVASSGVTVQRRQPSDSDESLEADNTAEPLSLPPTSTSNVPPFEGRPLSSIIQTTPRPQQPPDFSTVQGIADHFGIPSHLPTPPKIGSTIRPAAPVIQTPPQLQQPIVTQNQSPDFGLISENYLKRQIASEPQDEDWFLAVLAALKERIANNLNSRAHEAMRDLSGLNGWLDPSPTMTSSPVPIDIGDRTLPALNPISLPYGSLLSPVPTGTRQDITPASLTSSHYVTPSATSRKEVPSTFKRRIRAIVDDDSIKPDEELPPNATEQQQIEYKRIQNTLAARKSRQRKLDHLQHLEETIKRLTSEVEHWKTRAEYLHT